MIDPAEEGPPPDANALERACGVLAKIALVAMVALIGAELVMRNALDHSWEGTDEVGAYLLVAVTFLSLATSLAHGGFHELLVVKSRLSPASRAWLEVALQAVCLACAAILTWHFGRLVYTTWVSDERSLSALAVPLWIPRLAMPIGSAALCATLAAGLLRSLRAARLPEARP